MKFVAVLGPAISTQLYNLWFVFLVLKGLLDTGLLQMVEQCQIHL